MKKKEKVASIHKVVVVHTSGVSDSFKDSIRKIVGDVLVKTVPFNFLEEEFEFKGEAQIVICMPEVNHLVGEITRRWPYKTYIVALGEEIYKDLSVMKGRLKEKELV